MNKKAIILPMLALGIFLTACNFQQPEMIDITASSRTSKVTSGTSTVREQTSMPLSGGITISQPAISSSSSVESSNTSSAPITTTLPITTPSTAKTTTVAPPVTNPPTTTVTTTPPTPDAIEVKADAAAVNDGKTYSGRDPLPNITYKVNDPENKAGIDDEKHPYSFGVAKNGKPHSISVEHQKFFDDNDRAALTWDNKTPEDEKVLYLTFDCGYEYQGLTGNILDTLKEKDVKATFFCTLPYLKTEPEFVVRMINEGHIVGNHSNTHPVMPDKSKEVMAKEVLAVENYLRVNYGYSSKYFRFPTGAYSDEALELIGSVGYRSIFWSIAHSDWDTGNQPSKQKTIDTITSRLHPGAVILLHGISQSNADALADIIDYARAQGYEFRSLDQYPGW